MYVSRDDLRQKQPRTAAAHVQSAVPPHVRCNGRSSATGVPPWLSCSRLMPPPLFKPLPPPPTKRKRARHGAVARCAPLIYIAARPSRLSVCLPLVFALKCRACARTRAQAAAAPIFTTLQFRFIRTRVRSQTGARKMKSWSCRSGRGAARFHGLIRCRKSAAWSSKSHSSSPSWWPTTTWSSC